MPYDSAASNHLTAKLKHTTKYNGYHAFVSKMKNFFFGGGGEVTYLYTTKINHLFATKYKITGTNE